MTAHRLALANMAHNRGRAAISIVGAGFAVLLIFMQLGFLGATEATATILYGRLNFDLLLTSSEYLDFSRPGRFSRTRLAQAAGVSGVQMVRPISVASGLWRNPTADPVRGGRQWPIVALGVGPLDLPDLFTPGVLDSAPEAARELARVNSVYLDRKSKPDFGNPRELAPGTPVEFNGQRIELAGFFTVGTGFSYTGLLLMSERSLANLTPHPASSTTFALVTLAPEADPARVQAELEAVLPADVLVFTRAQIEAQEQDFWVNRTAVGQLFYFGVLLALIVGAIFVYQMMAADIKSKLPEYATLKAIGYRFGFLFRVVVWQGLLLATGGYTLGLLAALGLYWVTAVAAGLPMSMTATRLGQVFALTTIMCVGSALVAVRKVRTADPADLF